MAKAEHEFTAAGVTCTCRLLPPVLRDEAGVDTPLPALSEWQELAEEISTCALGSLGTGTLTVRRFSGPGVTVAWDIWRAALGNGVAMRQRVLNTGASPFQLARLDVARISLPAGTARPLGLLVQGRHKNDVPKVARLNGFAAAPQAGSSSVRRVAGDPFVQLQTDDGFHLLAGFLTIASQLVACNVSITEPDQLLDAITATCHLDGVEVGVGEERASEWLWLDWRANAEEAVAAYVEAVAALAGVKAPPPPPSVYCSWYYIDDVFSEEDLAENLAWLKDNPTPFDVFQMDMCWDRRWGDWVANHRWPHGMKQAADQIRAAGYRPGIWTCPFLVENRADLRFEHADWLLRRRDGKEVTFSMNGQLARVLDPTHPDVAAWLEDLFRRITHEWGFTYHKLDFTRAVALDDQAVFYDRKATRAEAYRRGLEAIRRGAGDNAYILVCGGLYGPALGLADCQRVGSDVHSVWDDHTKLTLQQSLLRGWMTRLWHTDPDALMVRRRTVPFKKRPLSLGFLTDTEARLLTLEQYLAGGIACVSERLCDLDADRYALWQQIMPSLGVPAVPLDLFAREDLPMVYRTRVTPRGAGLAPWTTVALVNWRDEERRFALSLDNKILGAAATDSAAWLAWEYYTRQFIGLFRTGDELPEVAVPAHDVRLFRLARWDGTAPVLLGTDLHLTGGGAEVESWHVAGNEVHLTVDTPWRGVFHVWVAFPTAGGEIQIVKQEFTGGTGPVQLQVAASR